MSNTSFGELLNLVFFVLSAISFLVIPNIYLSNFSSILNSMPLQFLFFITIFLIFLMCASISNWISSSISLWIVSFVSSFFTVTSLSNYFTIVSSLALMVQINALFSYTFLSSNRASYDFKISTETSFLFFFGNIFFRLETMAFGFGFFLFFLLA